MSERRSLLDGFDAPVNRAARDLARRLRGELADLEAVADEYDRLAREEPDRG